ncbi:hypothetical protein BO221_13725 [Archangium sp. Cb G35]|uniref:TIGR02270 family protein n=1 Tax=Archangium sp. Cb G35 TaxID=1920190 RepID=UPI00093720CC|nr:TIGR02270 family protein [Archangium sp. Cb G35]OJT24236.1 hypothetical protein BO221_13725 [Archangium sp. Cb G35]
MRLPMMDVIEEHLSEASFLLLQWERALRGPSFDLEELAELEERLLAHLDGLILGGEPVAESLLKSALEREDSGEVFAAAFASIAESSPATLEMVLATGAAASPSIQAAVRRALELSERPGLDDALVALLKRHEAKGQALVLEVLAFRNAVPRGAALELLGHEDGRVVAAALRSLESPGRDVMLPRLLADNRPEVRFAAIETGLLFGRRMAWDACRKEAEGRGGGDARAARVLLAVCGEDKDIERLVALVGDETVREDVLWALGFTGRASAVDVCLELMEQQPSEARLAGEAFSAITGLVLEGAYVLDVEGEEDSLPPLEEDLDADLSLRPEDELPVPACAAVADWWKRVRKDFSWSTRYLGGRPFSGAVLLEALTLGPMRRRCVHALELALRTQGSHQVQTFAFTARQRAELARAGAVCERMSIRLLAQTFSS